MRPLLCAFVLALAFFTSKSPAQVVSNRPPDSGIPSSPPNADVIVSLLQQSHELNNQMSPQAQDVLLRQQCELAAEVQPELARQWANELFLLAGQAKGPERSDGQDFAMSILARVDPDRALELLHAVELNSDDNKSMPFPAYSQFVQRVFQMLVQRDGEAALPAVEREAAFIGSKGTFPYTALGAAVSSAVSKNWRDNREHAIQIEQAALDRMFAQYSATPHTYFGDVEFGQLLKLFAGSLPIESVRAPLHLLVNNLLATDTSKYQYHAEVYTKDGESARVDNAIDAALLWIGGVIDRDPELQQQLESTRPELRDALEYAKPSRARSGGFGGMAGPPRPRQVNPVAQAATDATRLTHINPDVAIAKAEALPAGPERSRTLLQVARGISANDPERAAQLVSEAAGGTQLADEEMQLEAISAKASLASAQRNQDELHNLLQSGFELEARLMLERPKPFADGGLVQIGVRNDPALTTAFLQKLPPSEAKAHLLLDAAEALKLQRRLPIKPQVQTTR